MSRQCHISGLKTGLCSKTLTTSTSLCGSNFTWTLTCIRDLRHIVHFGHKGDRPAMGGSQRYRPSVARKWCRGQIQRQKTH